ncbi:MAG: hypothetical protein FWG88_06040 [Oscillospiraceae bacterium]|nr:hypothetical protein [Oscillospiraceae bacterium]
MIKKVELFTGSKDKVTNEINELIMPDSIEVLDIKLSATIDEIVVLVMYQDKKDRNVSVSG